MAELKGWEGLPLDMFKKWLTLGQRIEWLFTQSIKVDDRTYWFYCPDHGMRLGHPQGFHEILICDQCIKELDKDPVIVRALEVVEKTAREVTK